MLSASAGDLWQQVLPPGTRLLAGERGLGREVTWASTLRVRPPAFPNLGLGEMALLAADWLEIIDPPLGLAQALDGLAQRGAAAVAVMGQIPENAIRRAELIGIPLFQLPDETNIYELEGSIGRHISRQRTILYQRSAEVHRRLMQSSIQGKGMPGLLLELSQGTARAAALLDQWGRVRDIASPPVMKLTAESLSAALDKTWAKGFQGASPVGEGTEPLVVDLPLLLADWQAIGCALALRGQAAGYLLLIGKVGQLGPMERLALGQATSVFAGEMAKERAVVEAESRLKGGFLEELLEGELSDEEEMSTRASHLGYDISGASVVVVFGVEPGQKPKHESRDSGASTLRRILEAVPPGTPTLCREGDAVVLLPLAGGLEEENPTAKVETLRLKMAKKLEDFVVIAGIGRCYPGIRGLQRSYQEARRALALGKDMAPGGRTHYFGSLGIYPVLSPLWGTPEAGAFLEETLGRLLEYDRHNNAELAHTMEVYFSLLGNLGETAEALHLHRNSLSYRLRRIQEVAGISLSDAEACFRIQLALKLRRLMNP
ncbi:MAG: helix-turn-helix domain-containing protein [Dehalococcoidia bacterium]|nr:helix-turn-helix domain-containing protein [Dehalococcoidia bacterium]